MKRFCDCRGQMVHSLGACIGCNDKPEPTEFEASSDDFPQPVRDSCPACHGTGRRGRGSCAECDGVGSLLFTPVIKIVWEATKE